MTYYGYQAEQTKAQIRSTRGETIDLALPVTCLVGELRSFLIEEYGYDANTRLLYNGLVADDNSYVCDYPYGSLMIALPADSAPQQRQPLPPRQVPDVQQLQQQLHQLQPQQQQQQQAQRSHPAHTSPRSGNGPKGKGNAVAGGGNDSTMPPQNAPPAARKVSPTDGAPDVPKRAQGKNQAPTVKHQPKKSPRPVRSTSNESNGSQGKAQKTAAAASPPPPPPAVDPSPRGSDRVSTSRGNSARNTNTNNNVNSARSPPTPADSYENSATPASAAPSQSYPSQQQQPASQPTSTAAEVPRDDDDEVSHRQRVRFTVECHIPSLKKALRVPVNGESSVVDLILAVVAEAPEIGGEAQVIFRGKVLPQNAQAKLFDLGMRADTRVFIAAGEYSNPETITLLEIEEDTADIERGMQSEMTDLQRKGYYEELMRILFRTDGLQSLEGEWRQRRKDAVKRITSLQDALGVEGKNM